MNRSGLLQLAAHANALEEAALEFATSSAQQELSAQLLQVSIDQPCTKTFWKRPDAPAACNWMLSVVEGWSVRAINA